MTLIKITEKPYKTDKNQLLNYLLKVLKDDTHVIQDISLKNEKCVEIIEEIIKMMNEVIFFNQDAPDDAIVKRWDCCLIKLFEVGSLIDENSTEMKILCDDLKMSGFLIESNQEDTL